MDGATNRKFYFTITLKTFEEANDYCVNEGAILFEPKAEDINKRWFSVRNWKYKPGYKLGFPRNGTARGTK